jgi:transcriptional regulator with XRE-family HTH domain
MRCPVRFLEKLRMSRAHTAFSRLLQFWRTTRGQSQEQLADRIGLSARHVSRLETGRSLPSQDAVRALGKALDIGNRDLNHLMMSAGYCAEASGGDLFAPGMGWLRRAVAQSLHAFEPLSAMLMNEYSDILMINFAAARLFGSTLDAVPSSRQWNYVELLLAASQCNGLLSANANVIALSILAMRQNAIIESDPAALARADALARLPGVPPDWLERASSLEPMMSYGLILNINGEDRAFTGMHHIISAPGPNCFLSQPRLSIQILYPFGHPLLDEPSELGETAAGLLYKQYLRN